VVVPQENDPATVVMAQPNPTGRVVWLEEGVQTTVSIHEEARGHHTMFLNSWAQSSTDPDAVAVHRLLGHLPIILHPGPRDALVVGLGGGVTSGAVGQHPGVSLDVVELLGSVARGSEWFRSTNHDLLRRPNVRLRVDDGRNYLLVAPRRYDVITADVIWPMLAGAGNLYSLEYFRLAHRALDGDGIMLQWIGAPTETQYKMQVRTFTSVFPETTFWNGGMLMIGRKRPLTISRSAFERRLAEPTIRDGLRSVGVPDFDALLGRYWAGPDEMHRFVGDGPVLSDDRPMLEYFLSLPRDEPPPDVSGVRSDPRRYVVP